MNTGQRTITSLLAVVAVLLGVNLDVNGGGSCCDPPSTGDCCEAQETPCCKDDSCCAAVCDFNPSCCEIVWDIACASNATDLCEVCNSGVSNCCFANGGLGCDDPDCQAIVCGIDPFCCNTAWDSICAREAAAHCTVCGGNPTCPPDCGDGSGVVNTVDFLALLTEWGQSGTACDLGQGAPGVGVEDFLLLLKQWGPCQ